MSIVHGRWASALVLAAMACATSAFPLRMPPKTNGMRLRPGRGRRRVAGVRLQSSPGQDDASANSNNISGSGGGGGGGGRRSRRKPRLPDKNLYEILGASPSMSRAEIKRLYISLAKQTHPDSSPSNNLNDNDNDASSAPSTVDVDRFDEAARAWTVLSDARTRRSYDREVAARDFRDDVVRRADGVAREYGPTARRFYDDFAIPFLRRTTAAGVAGWSAGFGEGAQQQQQQQQQQSERRQQAQAEERLGREQGAKGGEGGGGEKLSGVTLSEVVREVSEMERSSDGISSSGDALEDFGRAFQRVIEAGRNVTRQIDGMEMQEKSAALRSEADEARAESTRILRRLEEIKSERLRLTFRTSSADFTSKEAIGYLDGLEGGGGGNGEVASVAARRMPFGNPLAKDLRAFAAAESEFETKTREKLEVDTLVGDKHRALQRAESDLRASTEAEERALRTLEDARARVADSRRSVVEAKESIRDMYGAVKGADGAAARADAALRKRRDAVRRRVRREVEAKAEECTVFERADDGEVRLNPDCGGESSSSMDAMGFEQKNLEAVEALRRDERRVEAEFLRLVDEARRLASRSETMRLRSEELIGEQREQEREQQLPVANEQVRGMDYGQAAGGSDAAGDTFQGP